MYVRKLSFELKDSNGNKENEARFTLDKGSNWLQIWTAASLLNIKGNKAIKKSFFLANQSVFPIMQVTALIRFTVYCLGTVAT